MLIFNSNLFSIISIKFDECVSFRWHIAPESTIQPCCLPVIRAIPLNVASFVAIITLKWPGIFLGIDFQRRRSVSVLISFFSTFIFSNNEEIFCGSQKIGQNIQFIAEKAWPCVEEAPKWLQIATHNHMIPQYASISRSTIRVREQAAIYYYIQNMRTQTQTK